MRARALILVALLVAVGCGSAQRPASKDTSSPDSPPVAARIPHTVTSAHGDRADPYFWLRDDTRKKPEVLAYLRAENRYTERQLAPTRALQDQLYTEIVRRIKQDDSSVPVLDNGYWYYRRYETGQQYPIHARKRHQRAPEEVLLDVNALAKGHAFFRLGQYAVSEDNRLVAYASDSVGRNQFRIQVKALATGKLLPDAIDDVEPSVAWHNDGRSFYYVAKEPKTLRSYRVYRHVLGTPQASDVLVYEEKDPAYYTSISRSKSRKYLLVELTSTTTSEVRLIDLTTADLTSSGAKARTFLPRERGHEYSIDHLDGRFVIRTNWRAKNFRVMQVAEATHDKRDTWTELVAHAPNAFVHEVVVYRNFVAVALRSGGLRKVRVLPRQRAPFFIDAAEPAYTMYVHDTPDPGATAVRYGYSSLTTPMTIYEHDVATRKRTLLKRQPVLGGFDAKNYVTDYLFAPARDGTKIPVSLVRHKRTRLDGTAPLYQYGYGSYGATIDPVFKSTVVSLLDRGFVYAIAHVRGSQKLGRPWYEAGKLLAKQNTFNDFVDVTRYLVAQRYAAPTKVFAEGGSAGGLLMGAVANQAPQLYRGIIAHVPFVDVITTMLDHSIPLTTNEFDEWGDPRNKRYYDYMLAYSPYDQVKAQAYPAMLVTTGLWDSQVQYWEPAKWVARLRKHKRDRNLLLLHVNMDAGHGGKSGRFRRYREVARDYAFLLHVLSRPDTRR